MRQQADRRRFLKLGAVLGGGALGACSRPPDAEEGPSDLGKPVSSYGSRSPFEKAARLVPDTKTPEAASSRTPLASLYGTITPNDLHFERHHAGVPRIDPAQHRLLIHGMVRRPLVFTVEEIRQFPTVSRVCFLECSGNSGSEWGVKTAPDVQRSHGLASCAEWTGVPLRLLLEEAGIEPGGEWLVAEGADACKMSRSVPRFKAMEDALVAFGQNGEALRPEQGYPLRLLVPGWEGNINVKWLRRIKVQQRPAYTKDETSKYTELMPDGTARIFTFAMDAKSVITFPSGGQKLTRTGPYEISGLAWSGRGRITRVDVSTDGGATWTPARLQEPVQPMAFTRFSLAWTWNGGDAVLVSRATDETGYVQPTREELVAVRGLNSNYHCNVQKPWRVSGDGSVRNADA